MADVSRFGDDSGEGDRGQLLLVAALVMAVLFVGLALSLNTAIYTENLATRGSDIAGGSVSLGFATAADEAVESLFDHANRNHNATHETLTANLTEGMEAWANATARQQSLSGTVIELATIDITNGSRIVQTNSSRDFTAADGTANWTLTSDADGLRRFRMNVTRASLQDVGQTTVETDRVNVFLVELSDDDGTWRVHLYRNLTGTDTLNATVEKPSGSFSTPCSVVQEDAVVDLINGTLAGNECADLAVVEELSTPGQVRFEETVATGNSTANGTYDVVLANSSVSSSPTVKLNTGPTADSPWVVPILYAVETDAITESSRLRYNTTIRIAPGEPDD